MTDRIIIDGQRIDIARGRHGLWYATSPGEPGLLVAEISRDLIEPAVRQALVDLRRARGVMTRIPALTIWQPWASLIIADCKPYEFRGWAAPVRYRGRRIAIHAGARPTRRAEVADLILRLKSHQAWTTCLRPSAIELLERVHASPGILPLSHVLGTAVLGDPVMASSLVEEFGGRNDSDRDEHFNFGWPLTDVQHLEPPEPAKGAQGLLDVEHGNAAMNAHDNQFRLASRPLSEIRDDVTNTEAVIERLSRIRDGESGHMRFRYGRVVEEAEVRLAEFRAELAQAAR